MAAAIGSAKISQTNVASQLTSSKAAKTPQTNNAAKPAPAAAKASDPDHDGDSHGGGIDLTA